MITALMTVYNAERWVEAAVRSILDQTMSEFELLVVDDGSTDGSADILDRLASMDERISIIRQENQGVARSANTGFRQARFDLVARIDADDLAYPQRFERQLAFFEANPEIVAAGSSADYINDAGDRIGVADNPFTSDERVQERLRTGRAIYFIHSSMMFRRDAVLDVGGYREMFPVAHDTDLINRLVIAGHAVRAQPERLVAYRLHGSAISRRSFWPLAEEIRWMEFCSRQLARGGPEPSREQFRAALRNAPTAYRLNARRKDAAFVAYKEATVARASGDLPRVARKLAVSAILDPSPTFNNIWRKTVRPRIQRDYRGEQQ